MEKNFYKHARLIFVICGLLIFLIDYILFSGNPSQRMINLIFLVKLILLVGGGTIYGNLLTRYYTDANTDFLTGLDNRQSFYSQFEKHVVRCYKENSELSLIAIDIDKFKMINDSYGHAIGDKALVQVASILKDNVRFSDVVGRVGGEEFLVLLPKTDLKEAYVVAERIKKHVEKEMPPFNGESVTVSIGISSLKGSYDKKKLLKLADKALYEAKETRNTVVTIKSE